MKRVSIVISCCGEKLSALKRYMAKKDLTLEAELDDAVDKLYEKYVPSPVREYIDDKLAEEAANPSAPRQRRAKDTTSGSSPAGSTEAV